MATGRVPTTANSPLTAKGDLFGYSTTQARVPVGSDGETLVADSSATTGLRWQGNFAAGKNKVINGDFGIWQRGTSFTATNYVYTADRWLTFGYGAGTTTVSRQTFTPGSAPVSGYEGQFFLRVNSTQTQTWIGQRIEDVRTLAGQTVTISFWAKASSGTPTVGINWNQDFGSGGSTAVNTAGTNQTISTSWARYSTTISVPSISGKTIGTNSNIELALYSTTINVNIDYWGVQAEAGNVATAFQTATGTLAGEYLACARYYQKSYNLATAPGTDTNDGLNYSAWSQAATTTGYLSYEIVYPVRMRTAATVVTYDVADASGKVSRVTPAGTDQNGLTPNTAFGNEARILIQSSSGNSHSGLALHWTASAEL